VKNRGVLIAWGSTPWTEKDAHEFIMRVLEINQMSTPPKRSKLIIISNDSIRPQAKVMTDDSLATDSHDPSSA
jgi:hypothetical protein